MIYIILPVHNRKSITLKFIDCLLNQTYENYRLILIDDGSTDGTSEEVLLKMPNTVIIKGEGNWWWAGSLQEGFLWLKQHKTNNEDIVLIINDDTIFNAQFLEKGVTLLEKKSRILVKALSFDIDSHKICDGHIHADLNNLRFNETINEDEANCASTRGLFVKANDLFDIGGFYPKKVPHYLSDYEFTIRAYRKGYKIITDDSLILNANFKTTGIQNIQSYSCGKYLSSLFSNSNAGNPLHWINFIIIVSDNIFYTIKNITRVILWTIKNLLVSIKISIKSRLANKNNS